MKKNLCIFTIIAIFLVVPCTNLKGSSNLAKFSLNVGGLGDKSFENFLWTAGVAIDINLANLFMLSPEGCIVGYGFEFTDFIGFAGGTGNITFGNSTNKFFVGAGPIIIFPITWAGDTALSLKIHAGLKSGSLRLTVYMMSDWVDAFSGFAFGATIGIIF